MVYDYRFLSDFVQGKGSMLTVPQSDCSV